MASIVFNNVHFSYPAAATPVFEDLSLVLDTGWRTGVVGRNGRGKTTLLKLVSGELAAERGEVTGATGGRRFPAPVADPRRATRSVLKDALGPFTAWERDMADLLERGGEAALTAYADLHERYVARGGYRVDADLAREFDALGLHESLLDRPFATLSGGEQTRALIATLFLDPDGYPLIDEPTNHLDAAGRDRLMSYLAGRRGFLLVSHDRHFLDGSVDHVLSLNRSDVRINRGNFTQWRTHADEVLAHEARTRQRIERDVARLESAARDTRRNAASREGDKYRTGALDKGFIGARAARQMRRARSVERRIESELAERRGLLGNAEKSRRLDIGTRSRAGGAPLLSAGGVTLSGGGRVLLRRLDLEIRAGERVALTGPNGCGKTRLLDALCGTAQVDAGLIRRRPGVTIARGHQHPLWRRGLLRERLRDAGLDETRFRQLLGVVGVGADAFDRDLSTFSAGQLKKVDLCRCLATPADLLICDEPLNYVDLYSREQIEQAMLEDGPTVLFVEHDRRFVDAVATRVLDLTARAFTAR